MFGHVDPFWDINQIKKLAYKKDYHKDVELVNRYVVSGHSADHIKIWNYFETDTSLPSMTKQLRDLFPTLSHVSIAINKLTPGQYLPLHKDLYQRYRALHNLNSTHHLRRIIIMIEDSIPGQISQCGNTVWGNWRAGDWFDWVDEFPHAAYNFSMSDRYAWQITGVLN